jgi:hypothetical protein
MPKGAKKFFFDNLTRQLIFTIDIAFHSGTRLPPESPTAEQTKAFCMIFPRDFTLYKNKLKI